MERTVTVKANEANAMRKTPKNLTPLSELRTNERGVKRTKVSVKDRQEAVRKLQEAGVARFVETDPERIKVKLEARNKRMEAIKKAKAKAEKFKR